MLEFALVLPIALFLVLIMAQSSLLMSGNLCVHQAAFSAARNAIVTVPLNLSPSESRNVVAGAGSAKRERIRQAAVWATAPVSCSSAEFPTSVPHSRLREGLGDLFVNYGLSVPGWLKNDDILSRRLEYADRYTTVTLDPPADGGTTYGDYEDLVVHVEHTFYMSVPYANYLFTQVLVPSDGRRLDFGAGEYGLVIRSTCRLVNKGPQDYVDVETFPHQP